MGRRSINTTKSGKYMNPTDQARKEARKKELKKNKKQRQMVRAAVLKMKDPAQILEELEKIDEMEYNVLQPSPLNEKVLKEKRKKLKETLDRVLKMYDKDEPEKWAELKRQEGDYERRRQALAAYYESVRHAQAVQVDDIPLPTLQVPDNLMYGSVPSQIPLPIELTPNMPLPPPMGILKKDPMFLTALDLQPALEPPGVPPGPPPSLEDMSDDENETKRTRTLRFADEPEASDQVLNNYDNQMDVDKHLLPGPSSVLLETTAVKPTSLQQRMLALSGQNIDEFMKEMEEVQRRREIDKANDLTSRLSALERRKGDSKSDDEDQSDVMAMAMFPPGTSGLDGSHIPPPLMANMSRPPPLRPPGPPPPGMRMPPPMQSRPAPPGPPPGPPPRMIRLPPGPPPGLPPRVLARPITHNLPPHPISVALPVFSAAPQLINRKDGSHGATIMAKPQIRNLSADVTRFVPSALRVRRDEKKVHKPGIRAPSYDIRKPTDMGQKTAPPTKDDAYMQFMQEMQGLL